MTVGRALRTAALALSVGVLVACVSPPRPAPVPRHVVLVTFDTLRADQLGCYDLRGDPLERHNLVSTAAASVKNRLRQLAVETSERPKREGQSVVPRPAHPAIQEELRALRYVQ